MADAVSSIGVGVVSSVAGSVGCTISSVVGTIPILQDALFIDHTPSSHKRSHAREVRLQDFRIIFFLPQGVTHP